MRRFRHAGSVCAAVLLVAACGSGTSTTTSATTTTVVRSTTTTAAGTPSSVPPSSTATSVLAPRAFATTPVSVAGQGGIAILAAVRTAAQNGFDRATFEFANRLPGYEVGYVQRPIVQDGSGQEVAIEGAAVLRVAMTPASGTDLSAGGAPTYTGPQRFSPGTPMLAEVVQTGDFEGHLTWVIGLPVEAGFNVSTLDSPPRLVIDIKAG